MFDDHAINKNPIFGVLRAHPSLINAWCCQESVVRVANAQNVAGITIYKVHA